MELEYEKPEVVEMSFQMGVTSEMDTGKDTGSCCHASCCYGQDNNGNW
jgi:hypothetical protein